MQPDNQHSMFTVEWFTALLTWLLVASTAVYFMLGNAQFSDRQTVLAGSLYLAFFIVWSLATRDKHYSNDRVVRIGLLILQFGCLVGIYFTVPFTYSAILAVMMCSIFPFIMPFKLALLLSLIVSLPLWLIYGYYWQREGMLITATLFWTFNVFALVMINAMIKARAAEAELLTRNRELLATQSLLREATKQSERVRIARNIHDLLGHHLTALTIKLQVAGRLSEGEAKQQIDECYGLSKLLLSDVREAVSEIREKSSLDLRSAIDLLIENTPGLNFDVLIDKHVTIDNVDVADALLKSIQESITNTLKHGDASQFVLQLSQQAHSVSLTMRDNGKPIRHFDKPGNGLTGIRERIDALSGSVSFSQSEDGFSTQITFQMANT